MKIAELPQRKRIHDPDIDPLKQEQSRLLKRHRAGDTDGAWFRPYIAPATGSPQACATAGKRK